MAVASPVSVLIKEPPTCLKGLNLLTVTHQRLLDSGHTAWKTRRGRRRRKERQLAELHPLFAQLWSTDTLSIFLSLYRRGRFCGETRCLSSSFTTDLAKNQLKPATTMWRSITAIDRMLRSNAAWKIVQFQTSFLFWETSSYLIMWMLTIKIKYLTGITKCFHKMLKYNF